MHSKSTDFWARNPWLAVIAAIAILSGLPFIGLAHIYYWWAVLVDRVIPGFNPVEAVMLAGPLNLFVTAIGLWIYTRVYHWRHRRPAGVAVGSGSGSNLPTTR
jgi:hypothetical protein